MPISCTAISVGTETALAARDALQHAVRPAAVSEIEDRALAAIMFDFWTARLRRELSRPNPDSFTVAQINKRLDELRGPTGQAA